MPRVVGLLPLAILGLLAAAAVALGLTHPQPSGDRGSLTTSEYWAAVHAAQDRVDRERDHTLTAAFAVTRSGRHVDTTNTSVQCPLRYLRITVVGTYPHTFTLGGPGMPHTVTSLLIDATLDGRPCLVGVGTADHYVKPAGAADLLPDLE